MASEGTSPLLAALFTQFLAKRSTLFSGAATALRNRDKPQAQPGLLSHSTYGSLRGPRAPYLALLFSCSGVPFCKLTPAVETSFAGAAPDFLLSSPRAGLLKPEFDQALSVAANRYLYT